MNIRDGKLYLTLRGLSEANQLNFDEGSALDYRFLRTIEPQETVSGWLFFDSRTYCPIGVGETYRFRYELDTYSKVKYEYVTPELTMTDGKAISPGSSIGETR